MTNLSIQKNASSVTFQLEGALEDLGVDELETAWELLRHKDTRFMRIDVCKLNQIDEPGKALLSRTPSSGVQFVIPPHSLSLHSDSGDDHVQHSH